MTLDELARVLVRAADIAEANLDDREATYTHQEYANMRLLRWLADGAAEIRDGEALRTLQRPAARQEPPA